MLVRRLRYAVPQWQGELSAALTRSRQRFASARIDGIDWYWPDGEPLCSEAPEDAVAWRHSIRSSGTAGDSRPSGAGLTDSKYTPAAKRKLGYYALPLLWRDRVIGWGNVTSNGGGLDARVDYVDPAVTREPAFKRELDLELDRMHLPRRRQVVQPPGRSSQRTPRLLENVLPKPDESPYD